MLRIISKKYIDLTILWKFRDNKKEFDEIKELLKNKLKNQKKNMEQNNVINYKEKNDGGSRKNIKSFIFSFWS